MKWLIPWGTPEYPTSRAPSIITIFIKMVLQPGKWPHVRVLFTFTDYIKDLGIPLYGDHDGLYQANLQLHFLGIILICTLLILVPKPLILWLKSLPKPSRGYTEQIDDPSTKIPYSKFIFF